MRAQLSINLCGITTSNHLQPQLRLLLSQGSSESVYRFFHGSCIGRTMENQRKFATTPLPDKGFTEAKELSKYQRDRHVAGCGAVGPPIDNTIRLQLIDDSSEILINVGAQSYEGLSPLVARSTKNPYDIELGPDLTKIATEFFLLVKYQHFAYGQGRAIRVDRIDSPAGS